ncbi:MAG TPA: DUF2752 domain-containing protein [Acidimicrobiia bacterium]|nr:DUF2752 domain-containing protein [Acidimicrobiia bacterium]
MRVHWRDRLIIAAPVAVVGLLALAPVIEDGPTLCPFAICTGMACPGCGMTRAAAQLLRGDFGAAMTFHPLVPLIALQLVAGWVWYLLNRAGRADPVSNRALNVMLIATSLALLGVWLARILSGTLPAV